MEWLIVMVDICQDACFLKTVLTNLILCLFVLLRILEHHLALPTKHKVTVIMVWLSAKLPGIMTGIMAKTHLMEFLLSILCSVILMFNRTIRQMAKTIISLMISLMGTWRVTPAHNPLFFVRKNKRRKNTNRTFIFIFSPKSMLFFWVR
jgi:hypothetical protein